MYLRLLIGVCAFVSLTAGLRGQITIESEDSPYFNEFLEIYCALDGVTLPVSSDVAQTWDYSNLVFADSFFQVYAPPASFNPYPDENVYDTVETLAPFAQFVIPTVVYFGRDEDSRYEVGRRISEITYPLESLTGNPSDELRFPDYQDDYGPVTILQYPMFMGASLAQEFELVIPFELTLGMAGLDNTPGEARLSFTDTLAVEGFGTLVIPDRQGNPSEPLDALLVRNSSYRLDSFFLGGGPAPQSILDAFGLVQGTLSRNDLTQLIYVPGYRISALAFTYTIGANDEAFLDGITLRPEAAEQTTGLVQVAIQQTTAYPNPARAGQSLHITTELPTDAAVLTLYDINGRMHSQHAIPASGGGAIEIGLPNHLSAGQYFYHLVSENDLMLGVGKVVVE